MQGISVSVNKIGAQGDIALLRIKGYIDTTTSTELYNTLSQFISQNMCQFIIDMGGVNYVSSAGWGVFIGEIRGIRERGGDLKVAQMTPDVYEVFAMLEFTKILDYYDNIEEAVNDFDISLGFDITQSIERKPIAIKKEDVTITVPPLKSTQRVSDGKTDKNIKKWTTTVKPKVDETNLPLVEKIKLIVLENPNDGLLTINKKLQTARFGSHKVNILKLRSILKKYNLETKEKRYRFYRSR